MDHLQVCPSGPEGGPEPSGLPRAPNAEVAAAGLLVAEEGGAAERLRQGAFAFQAAAPEDRSDELEGRGADDGVSARA